MTTAAEGTAIGVFRDAHGHAFISYVRDPTSELEMSLTSIRTSDRVGRRHGAKHPRERRFPLELIEKQLDVERLALLAPPELARALGWVLLGDPIEEPFGRLRERTAPEFPDPRSLANTSIDATVLDDAWPFVDYAASADLVIVERSPPSATSLISILGTGTGSLVAAANDEPMLLVYSLGFLVIVRVIDPVLTTLGERLAARLRLDDREDPRLPQGGNFEGIDLMRAVRSFDPMLPEELRTAEVDVDPGGAEARYRAAMIKGDADAARRLGTLLALRGDADGALEAYRIAEKLEAPAGRRLRRLRGAKPDDG